MPRTRNPAACATCRRRKLKCDDGLPSCRNCLRAKRYCDHQKDVTFRHHFWQDNTAESTSVRNPQTLLRSEKTARLFDHYCKNLAPWYDLSDGAQAFQIEVPQNALSRPLLLGAILAFAAIHTSRTTAPSVFSLAQKYHSQCLELLIAMQDTSEELSDGTALAAVCLLRSYEILAEDFDPNRHLSGAHALADSGSVRFDRSSLLRAGYFNYLREDITYGLQYRSALKTSLKDLPRYTAAECDEDQLNVASLFVARAINATFTKGTVSEDRTQILQELKSWRESLNTRFEPYSETPSRDYSASLPRIWMFRDCHTSTLQYYLVSLALLEPFEQAESAVLARLNEYAIKTCGLAFTSGSPTVIVNSFGPISYCARFLQSKTLQEELVRRLQAARKSTGWPVQRIIDELADCWKNA